MLPHRETKLRTIVSNTGCTSVGEPEIMRNISAVAVCCSGGSASSSWGAELSLPRHPLHRASARPRHERNRRDECPPSHEALPRRSEPCQGQRKGTTPVPTLRGAWTGGRRRERNALFCAA